MKPIRRNAFSSVRVAETRVMTDLAGGSVGFLHARRLALEVAQVLELGAANLRTPHELDALNRRRVQREDSLHALPERHLAHREGGIGPAPMHPDHDAF